MDQLLRAMIRYFEQWVTTSGLGSETLELVVDAMNGLGDAVEIRPNAAPVTRNWLAHALQQSDTALIAELAKTHHQLHWKSAPLDYVDVAFSSGFAFTQLFGQAHDVPDGVPFLSDKIAGGFSLQAPNLFYPPHYHKSAEFYGVLTGTAHWQLDQAAPQAQPPGSYIFHDNNIPHAMKSNSEPSLCVWAWYGDLDAPTAFSSREWLRTTHFPKR